MIHYNEQSKRKNPLQQTYDDVNKHPKKINSFPAFVDVELTNICNLNCKMCPRSLATRKEGFMCSNLLHKVAIECKKFKAPIRFIGWGEPLLHPEVCLFIRYIKNKENQPLHITTNGLAFRPKVMDCIINNKVDSIIFSLQGLNAKQYKSMRRVDKYDKLKENIQQFVRKRGDKKLPFVQVTTTVVNSTKRERERFIKEWLPLVDAVSIGQTNMSFFEPNTSKKYRPCTEVYHQIQVDYDGKVSACCGDYDNFLTIGNVHWEALYDTWNTSKRLQSIREILKDCGHKSLTLCSRCFPTYDYCD